MNVTVFNKNTGFDEEKTLSKSDVGLGNVTNDAQIPKSIVTTKGDIIVATGNVTPVRQGVGNNGQIIVADDNLTNGLGYKDPAFENWVMNGNFDIAQRGTSFTNPATGTYTADRFKVLFSVDGGTNPTITHSQQSFTPGGLLGSKNFYRVNVNGAGSSYGANSYYVVAHYIEHGTLKLCGNGKKVTVSIQGTSDIASKKIGIYLIQNYGTGGSPTSQETITGDNFTLTSSLVKNSYTFTTNTLSGKTFGTDNNDALILMVVYEWGSTFKANVGADSAEDFVSSGNIDIAQVALYAGDVAYPFEPVPFDIELQRCMRYCQVLKRLNLIRCGLYTTDNLYFYYRLGLPLRISGANLTFIGTANTDYGVSTLTATPQSGFTFSTDVTFKDCISIRANKISHGLTDGIFYFFTNDGRIIIDADF